MVLSILYLEVCARLGLTLRAQLLDDERYVVLWPQPSGTQGAEASQIAGFVVDAYGGGDLIPVHEVSEGLGLKIPGRLTQS